MQQMNYHLSYKGIIDARVPQPRVLSRVEQGKRYRKSAPVRPVSQRLSEGLAHSIESGFGNS